jgi:hypothetical protein
MSQRVGLPGQNGSNALNAYAPKLLPELPDCLSSFVALFTFERHLVSSALLPFRQDADAALGTREVLGDTLFRKHTIISF